MGLRKFSLIDKVVQMTFFGDFMERIGSVIGKAAFK